jgi:phospholipid/cholesterol/gamma-HCH transport system substrate-binding protein
VGAQQFDEVTGEPIPEEEGSSLARRAAQAALVIAVVAVAYVLLFGGSQYTVTLEFQNASQLVPGNIVAVGGDKAGTVKSIELGAHGQALVEISLDDQFAPLPTGTTAQIRAGSLSSVAGRRVELTIPAASDGAAPIAAGGEIPLAQTTSEVDLDQIFNTLSPKTIADFKHVIQGFDISYSGVAKTAGQGFKYANPFLSTTRRVFGELTLDTPRFERLLIDTSHLSGALAQRAPDLSLLIHNLNLMMGALGRQKVALAAAISKFPDFMRAADTTFVNLRSALDDLDPLVAASKPVADRLRPFFHVFRGAARDAVPTITKLDQIVARPGPNNDLTELTADTVPLARVGVGSGSPDCGQNPSTDYASAADGIFTQGALGESICALKNGLPSLAFFRPYTPELVGWFNDFGTSGVVDANGGIGRIGTTINTFSFSTPGFPQLNPAGIVPYDQLLSNPSLGFTTGQIRRCQGALERDRGDGSTPFTDGGNLSAGPGGCDPSQVPTGP